MEYQKTGWLTDEEAFQLRHDLFLTNRITKRTLVADAKYKLRGEEETDKKAGVAQSDMYQLVSYALRSGCATGLLLYPAQDQAATLDPITFTVSSCFMPGGPIYLWANSLPLTTHTGEDFTDLKQRLHEALRAVFSKVETS